MACIFPVPQLRDRVRCIPSSGGARVAHCDLIEECVDFGHLSQETNTEDSELTVGNKLAEGSDRI